MLKKYDKVIATVFVLLTIVFIVAFLTNCTALFLSTDSLSVEEKMALIALHRSVSSAFKTVMERGEQGCKRLVSIQTRSCRTGNMRSIYFDNKKKR